jgi:hypothetical protein
MAVFWVAAPCSLVELYQRLEVLAACNIRAMSKPCANQPTSQPANQPTNQPTNQKAKKSGVLRKLQTSSLARSDKSCVRSALLEMVKVALKL